MNEKQLKQSITQLADSSILERKDPYLIVRKHVEEQIRKKKSIRGPGLRQRRLRWAGLITLIVILAGTLFLITPQGQALAQDILRFFSRAASDEQAAESGQSGAAPASPTIAATQMLTLQDVTPGASAAGLDSYPTKTPASSSASDQAVANLTIPQAEELAGFTVRVPAILPEGYRLDNVIYNPQTKDVMQIYEFHPYSAGEQFIIHQTPMAFNDEIGQSARVETLRLGGKEVEYVNGSWFGENGAALETWSPISIFHTFRWQEGEYYFALEVLFDDSDTWSSAYWTAEGMQAMVEIIMGVRAEFPEQVNYSYITDVSQAEEIAGFALALPGALPDGYVFTRASYEPEQNTIVLHYEPQNASRATSGVGLVIMERQILQSPAWTWEGYPENAVTAVAVAAGKATLVTGTVVDGTYDPDSQLTLMWSTNDLSIKMIWSAQADVPDRLGVEELIAIAESMP